MKRDIKLVAVDIDGTFVRNDYSYDVDWFTAITKMQNVNKKANIAVLYNKPKDYIKNIENINNMTKTENNEDGASFSGLSNKYKSYKYNLMVNKELLAYEGASLDDETLKTIYGLGAFIIGIVLVSSVFVIRNGFEISITEKVHSIFVMNLKVLKIRLLYLFSIKSC